MKYFAKYLPIEGEIKEGNLIATRLLPNVPIGNASKEQIELGINKQGNYTKVKLFLCSRNIQRNDSIYCSIEDYQKRSPILVQEHAIEALKEKRAFKVIGEISPEATYVKEGDEFEAKDLQYPEEYWPATPSNDGAHTKKYPFTISDEQPYDHIQLVVQVKGPCGHYH